MSFLSWLGWQKLAEDSSNVLKFPEPKSAPFNPYVAPKRVPVSKEHYRIGYDNERDMVTLTLLDNYNNATSTLSMNKAAAEQLIRMLRSAFPTQQEKQNG